MRETTPRWVKIGDALSQLINVTFLPKHTQTNANESISGRAYRMGWKKTAFVIDLLLLWLEKDHCKAAYLKDIERAKELLAAPQPE